VADILTPRCPLCRQPPAIALPGAIQAFCGNDDCTLLCWNPSLSLDANLLDAGVVHLPPMTEDEGKADGDR
jgi:hypothetical protein